MATYTERLICRVIWYFFSGLSLFTSLLTPVVIRKMKTWNGTLMLVVSLSWTLAVYSFGLLLTFIDYTNAVCQLQGSLIYFAGISSALWTTCFSTTLLMLVIGVRFNGITHIFKYYFAVCTGIPLVITAVGLSRGFIGRSYLSCFVETDDLIFEDIYDVIIFVCVVYNVVFFLYCFYRIGRMGGANSPSAKALKEACYRMMYYPIGQSFCWLFIWMTFFVRIDHNQANPHKFIPLLLDSLSSPLFGTVMFIVFCLQHPTAFRAIKDLLIPKCCRFYHRPESVSSNGSAMSLDGRSESGASKTAQLGSTRPTEISTSDALRKDVQRTNGSSRTVQTSGETNPSKQCLSKLTELTDDLIDDIGLHLPEDDERDSGAIFRQSGSTVSRPTTISMVSRSSAITGPRSTTGSLQQALLDNQHNSGARKTSITGTRSISVSGSLTAQPIKIDSVKSTTRKSLHDAPTSPQTNGGQQQSGSEPSSFASSLLKLPNKFFGGNSSRASKDVQPSSRDSSRTNSRSTSRTSSVARTSSTVSSRVHRNGSRSISRVANFSNVEEADLFRMIQETTVYEDEAEGDDDSSATSNRLIAETGGISTIEEADEESSLGM